MSKNSKVIIILLLVVSTTLLSGFMLGRPSGFIVLRADFYPRVFVPNAPRDMEITMHFDDGRVITPSRTNLFWDSLFVFYNARGSETVRNAVLVIESQNHNFETGYYFRPPPQHTHPRTHTLRLSDGALREEVPQRGPVSSAYTVLILIRLVSLLCIKVLLLRSAYREKRSYITVLIVGAITQGAIFLISPSFSATIMHTLGVALIFFSLAVFVVEAIVFSFLLQEHDGSDAIRYTFKSNVATFGLSLFWLFILHDLYSNGSWSHVFHWTPFALMW